jgi:hypothetical protein
MLIDTQPSKHPLIYGILIVWTIIRCGGAEGAHGWMDGPWVGLLTLRSKLPLMAQDRELVIEPINHLGFVEP